MSYILAFILYVHYHSGTSLFSRNRGIPKPNPDLVPNSGPIPDHFWHFGPDPDQVRNSGPFRSHCTRASWGWSESFVTEKGWWEKMPTRFPPSRSLAKASLLQCTMCSVYSFFSIRPSEVRHVVKFHGYIAIKHIFIPARSVEWKIEKIWFS